MPPLKLLLPLLMLVSISFVGAAPTTTTPTIGLGGPGPAAGEVFIGGHGGGGNGTGRDSAGHASLPCFVCNRTFRTRGALHYHIAEAYEQCHLDHAVLQGAQLPSNIPEAEVQFLLTLRYKRKIMDDTIKKNFSDLTGHGDVSALVVGTLIPSDDGAPSHAGFKRGYLEAGVRAPSPDAGRRVVVRPADPPAIFHPLVSDNAPPAPVRAQQSTRRRMHSRRQPPDQGPGLGGDDPDDGCYSPPPHVPPSLQVSSPLYFLCILSRSSLDHD
jgi:hypothetical protein